MAKKGGKTPPASQEKSKSKKKGQNNEKSESDQDRRAKQQANRAKVTSTSSWTGKLPHTLLHEHCQKRKWNKVEYDMKKIGDKGMLAFAILSYTDPKTKEILTIRMNDPTFDKSSGKGLLVPQETPIEARHMAATVALYRIAFNTNLHMMLPPNHKTLWYELDDFRKKFAKQNSFACERIFNVEPFQQLLTDRKAKELHDKEQEAKQQQAEKAHKAPILITSTPSPKVAVKEPSSLDNRIIKFPNKVWENATFIDLEESSRSLIEKTLKTQIDWTAKKYVGPVTQEREYLESKLQAFGFRKPHVIEAMTYADPLSFLLFNLPEDDLPEFFHKRLEDSKMKVEIASLPLPVRNALARLMESGVSYDEALYALQTSNMDENEAAGFLTEKLLTKTPTQSSQITTQESQEIWQQELESLQSIYGDDVIEILNDDKTCFSMQLLENYKLKLKVYKTSHYPDTIPGIIVSTFDKNYKLPNYIKLAIVTRLLEHVAESSLLGDMLVYHMFEWLQENISSIIDNPGRLLQVVEGSNKTAQTREVSKSRGRNYKIKTLSPQEIDKLKSDYSKRRQSSSFENMQQQRSKLPAWKIQDKIVKMIMSNDVVLITGETGSGKSTQVVQFVLDHLIAVQKDFAQTKIICTQPRRISAIGLAERVSDERCVECGDEVGYVIRGVNKTSAFTRIKFMTTGVLVRILQTAKDFLQNTIVFIDEVHERSVDTDLIVILLKNLMGRIPGLKIVLMSATVNVDVFKKFFGHLETCHIEGRTFPIKDYFLEEVLEILDFKIKRKKISYDDDVEEDPYLKPSADSKFFRSGQLDYDLITGLVNHVHQRLLHEGNDGSILIFLPGVGEISSCCKNLAKMDEFTVLPLHSALTPEDQKKVFRKYSKRKIVVSTNIAETSITIDDCVATIDSGRVKNVFYNPTDNVTKLQETFVSRAEAQQRRGRAGRVRAGYSFKLFSKSLYNEMQPLPTPEIKRVALESLYLSVKAMGIKNVIDFLGTGLDPPPLKFLQKSQQLLTAAGLLAEFNNSLTELGRFISLMPVMDYKHGKLLIYSIIFGCTDLGVLIVSILGAGGSPFIITNDNRDSVKKICSSYGAGGDLLAMTHLIRAYFNIRDNGAKRAFVRDHHLSFNKLRDIASSKSQLYSMLKDVGFLPIKYTPGGTYLNRNAENWEIVQAILTGAFYPQVARVQQPDPKYVHTSSGSVEREAEAKLTKLWLRNEEYIDRVNDMHPDSRVTNSELPATRAFLHPSSIFFDTSRDEALPVSEMTPDSKRTTKRTAQLRAPFVVYNSSHATTKLYLRDITPTSTLALLLFGGPIKYDLNAARHSPGIIVDNWLPIRTWCKNGVLIKELRSCLDRVIREKLEDPSYISESLGCHGGDDVLGVVESLVKQA